MKRLIFTILKSAGMLVLLFLVLAALFQTTKGKEILASALSKAASRSANVQVHVGRISGWIPLAVRVDSVAVGDEKGSWLIVRNLRGRWMLRDLLDGTIRVAGLGADEIEWIRFPQSNKGPEESRGGGGRLDGADIVLQGWEIDHLKLGPALAGIPLEYSVRSGGIVISGGKLSGDLAIRGDADGRVDFEASFADPDDRQLSLHAALEQMKNPTLGMDRLSGSVDAIIDARGVNASIDADLERSAMKGHVSSRLHYASRLLHLEGLRFDGQGYVAQGDLDLGFSNGQVEASIDALLIDAKERGYTLQGTAHMDMGNKTWSVDVPAMNVCAWDTVSMSLTGRFDAQQVDLVATLAEFDLGTLPYSPTSNYTGRVSGNLSVRGAPASPELNAALEVDRLGRASRALDELPKLDFRIDASLSGGELSASTSMTNFISGYLVADASMPCRFSIVPFGFDADSGKVDGALDAILDLDVFNGLAVLDNQLVRGVLSAELNMEDSVPSGFIRLEKGGYEHYAWGLLFQDFQGILTVTPAGFEIGNTKATDGAGGRLILSGGMAGDQLDVSLALTHAKVLRRPEAEAVMSGSLKLAGPLARPELTGKLVVDRADLLPDNIVPRLPPVLEDFDAADERESIRLEKRSRPFPIGMDVKLEMSDQIYVVASLIDSVWGGSLRLRDTPKGVWLKGGIEPRRGHVDFVGKKFRLVDGMVELDNVVHPVPVMNNLTAEYARSDLSARLILNGSVNSPQYRLESTPAFPEDEILSRILFGREASTITSYQAVQIAIAAQQLSGGLNGPGFMYQFRNAVGVDTLEWREAETGDGSSAVAAGKYVTPELYVEVSSTFGTEAQTDLTAEYEINRHFSIETSAGPRLRPGIGLNWKNDY